MCSGVKKVFDAVIRAVKKVWDVIRKYIVYIVVIAAIFWPVLLPFLQSTFAAYPSFLAWLPTSGIWAAGASGLQAMVLRGLAALSFGFFMDSETTREIVEKVADVAGDVAEAVGDIGGEVLEGAASGLLSSPWLLAAGAFAVWWFFLRDDSKDEEKRRQRLENDRLELELAERSQPV